jgi:hypothetical protein
MKTTVPSILMILSLTCVGLLPKAEAVTPPLTPDPGPKPVSNTADGQNALLSITTGIHNTAIGFDSLLSNSAGNFNTAVGSASLLSNVGGSLDAPNGIPPGAENTATGAAALLSNTIGSQNTANGAFALFSNTEANANTATGDKSLFLNTTGDANTATGADALFSNTEGSANTGTGVKALSSNTEGDANTASGANALRNNITGSFNTASGQNALNNNIDGDDNTAVGQGALFNNISGGANIAVGEAALSQNSAGNFNTAVGNAALANATGSGNIAIGFQAGAFVGSSGSVIAIGSPGDDVDNSCFIGNIRDVQTQNADAIQVVIDSAGQLGTVSSSARFKKEIKPMDNASEAILALKPVTFQYKGDKTGTPQFGLIAEEVAKVNPNLTVRDKSGEIYTVRYDAVNAMLLNEFLKEHQKVEDQDRKLKEQQAIIAQLSKDLQTTQAQQQKKIEGLAASLQKVSTQLEIMKSAPQTVLNGQ